MSNACIDAAHQSVADEITALGDDAHELRLEVSKILQTNPPDAQQQLEAIEVALEGIDGEITYQEGRDSGIDEGFACCPS